MATQWFNKSQFVNFVEFNGQNYLYKYGCVMNILLASYFCFLYCYSPFSASCPICGKELLPNKVASHIRHETNSLKGNMSTDQQDTDQPRYTST
jgi:hypothetical protein